MNKTKRIAIKTLEEAGEILMKHFLHFKRRTVMTKKPHDLLTQADIKAENIIIKNLKRHFPKFNIISEEKGLINKKSPYSWIVDPLDGTTNFIMANPLFASVLSLWYKKDCILCFFWAPYLEELYWAEKNKGAFLNSKKIHVSGTKKLKDAYLTFCHGSKMKFIDQSKTIYSKLKTAAVDFRQLGSSGLEMCFVAAGKTDGHIIPGGKIWDAGAGTLLVREAGGKVTDFKNRDWRWGTKDFLATNSKIHQEFLRKIKNL
jgi:myo-inositol-1(or 4)-monophosphatase